MALRFPAVTSPPCLRSLIPPLSTPPATVLRRTFGHADFRGLQAGVIGELLAGRSAMAVLPTGGGKSLCYQIPALIRPGLGLVVSPLIALMADQVAGLQQAGVAWPSGWTPAPCRASAPAAGRRHRTAGELDLAVLVAAGHR